MAGESFDLGDLTPEGLVASGRGPERRDRRTRAVAGVVVAGVVAVCLGAGILWDRDRPESGPSSPTAAVRALYAALAEGDCETARALMTERLYESQQEGWPCESLDPGDAPELLQVRVQSKVGGVAEVATTLSMPSGRGGTLIAYALRQPDGTWKLGDPSEAEAG